MYLIKDNKFDRYTDGNGNYFILSKIFLEKENTSDGIRFKLKQFYTKETKALVKK